jgi:hypothetical protein
LFHIVSPDSAGSFRALFDRPYGAGGVAYAAAVTAGLIYHQRVAQSVYAVRRANGMTAAAAGTPVGDEIILVQYIRLHFIYIPFYIQNGSHVNTITKKKRGDVGEKV